MEREEEEMKPMKLTYENLSEAEKKFVCNGCGGKGSFIPVPNFFFEASCQAHDLKYFIGCTEIDRLNADNDFYKAMKRDCKRVRWYLRILLFPHAWAWIYYKAVRLKGKKFFHFAEQKRTREDLWIAMGLI